MNAVVPILVTAIAVALAVGALLLVRRRAPEGGFFADGDRAAGMFGVLASGFAILLGFVVFLSFESFDSSRTGAETEAILVAQQFETAQFLPVAVRGELSTELICYGRSVIGQEWPQMERGEGALVNPWGVELFASLKKADPQTPVEETAFGKWFDQTSERQAARSARIHGAEGVMPRGVWLVLFFMAAVLFVFMMFFADSAERAWCRASRSAPWSPSSRRACSSSATCRTPSATAAAASSPSRWCGRWRPSRRTSRSSPAPASRRATRAGRRSPSS